MLAEIQKDARVRMGKSLESLRHELAKIRTGRAHPSLLEHVHVDYYGSEVPISQAASVAVEDARTLMVTPWDKGHGQGGREKPSSSPIWVSTPSTAGQVIRIPLPPLTEERRRELGKVVHHEGENTKIAIRNIRRDAIHHIKDLLKEKEISEDDERKAEHEIQNVTDTAVGKADGIVAEKEKELLEI